MFGITIRVSNEATAFWELVDEAAALEDAPSFRTLNYPAHLTMARYSAIDPSRLAAGLQAVASGGGPLTIAFDRVCFFDTAPLVLWLHPQDDRRLRDLHRHLHATIGEEGCDPHYRPLQWQPHATLASSVSRRKRQNALDFAEKPIAGLSMTFDVAEALQWPPVSVLHSRKLS